MVGAGRSRSGPGPATIESGRVETGQVGAENSAPYKAVNTNELPTGFTPRPNALGFAVFGVLESLVILLVFVLLARKHGWEPEYAGFAFVMAICLIGAVWSVFSTAGYRILLTPDSLHYKRFGRTNRINWTEITGVAVFDRHVSIGHGAGTLKIRWDIDRYGELVTQIRRRAGHRFAGCNLTLPIRFYYPMRNDSSFWVPYAALIVCYLLEPLEGQFNDEVGFFLFFLTALAVWIVYARSHRYVFDRNHMNYGSLVSRSEVAATEIRDMWLEHVEDAEHGPYDQLHFNLPGGEELKLFDGNIGVKELFAALEPHYLKREGSRLARTTSVLGI